MAYLYLEDGTLLEGKAFGAETEASGEIVFSTGMEGYQETMTDPACAGQIVVMTYPLIGNYGVNDTDAESDRVHVAGLVVHEKCDCPSNWQCSATLEDFMKRHNVPGIEGIDTRYLTRKIREAGTLHAAILCKKPSKNFSFDRSRQPEAAFRTGSTQAYAVEGGTTEVAVLDLGVTRSALEELKKLGARLTVYPAATTAAEILEKGHKGVLISSGPENSNGNETLIQTVKSLCQALPVLGVGLGGELVAAANGAALKRLPHGHRGANQPVKDLATGKMLVTSQNHGYTLEEKSLPAGSEVTYRNWNDNSVEGARFHGAECVLFYPASNAGPHDSTKVYRSFLQRAEEAGK